MDLDLTEEQAELVQSFKRFFEKECPPNRVRDAEPLGFDRDLWALTRDQGVLDMAVTKEAGGWGASLLDVALVAEQHGRSLTPIPIIEAQTAARLLAAVPSDDAQAALAMALAGERLVTLAVTPEGGGGLRLVPGGAVADQVIFGRDDRLMTVAVTDANRRLQPNLASMPLADVETGDARVLWAGREARAAIRHARDEWMVLTATALVGLASRALEVGCAYAANRYQFGVPIATFQAVSHRLADSAAMVDGARLLCYEAACSWDDRLEDGAAAASAAALPAMAFSFAAAAARETSTWSLHVHGGYGFMTEYDVQLYFRRAKGWANVVGDPRRLLHEVADRLYASS